jgi:histone H3/H4
MAKAKKAAKAAKAAGKKSKGSGEELGSLVVASKVRQYVRSRDVNMSSEVLSALNATLINLLNAAVSRTAGNKRKTLRAVDL